MWRALLFDREDYTLENGALRVHGGIDQDSATAFATEHTQILNIDLQQSANGVWDGDEDSVMTLNGTLSGSGNITVINGQASGRVARLNQSGTYSGTMTINSGHILLGDSDALQDADIVVNHANGLQFASATSFTIGTLAGTANLGIGGNTLSTSHAGGTTFSGNLSGSSGGSFRHGGKRNVEFVRHREAVSVTCVSIRQVNCTSMETVSPCRHWSVQSAKCRSRTAPTSASQARDSLLPGARGPSELRVQIAG